MSESLSAGHLPLWNPYINFGFPQYGDMSGGYWSPVVWLISLTVGYTAYIFTLEIIFYILIGGLGLYKLCNALTKNKLVSWIAGISFMCSGFTVGHLQHVNWLSGIAFLPWCIYFVLQLQVNTGAYYTFINALLFYLFISAAHPSLIISAFYFFIALMTFTFYRNELHNGWRKISRVYLRANAVLTILLLLLLCGLIFGYLDILPHFVRGQKLSIEDSLKNASSPSTWTSMLLPFQTVKNPFLSATDPSMRNHYMGLLSLIFLLNGVAIKKSRWQWFFLISGILFLLLSTGGIFKTIAYHTLPMMSYVRLNGVYAGLALLCFILFSFIGLHRYITEQNNYKRVRNICYILTGIFFLCFLIGLIKALSTGTILFMINTHVLINAKSLVDSITFYDTIWMQSAIQLLLMTGIMVVIKKKKYNLLLYLCIADIVMASLLQIPFTGAGKASVADVQTVLNKTPGGIPIPALKPILTNDTLTKEESNLTGHWSMYSKQPGVIHEVLYPITLLRAHDYFMNVQVNKDGYMHRPLLFAIDSTEVSTPIITEFSPGRISFTVHTNKNTTIIYQQNYYPHWYFQNETGISRIVDNGSNFMHVPLTKGKNEISIFFNPGRIKSAMLLSATTLMLLIIAVLYLKATRRNSLSTSLG